MTHMQWLHNFSPVAAIALCGAIYFPRKIAILAPLTLSFDGFLALGALRGRRRASGERWLLGVMLVERSRGMSELENRDLALAAFTKALSGVIADARLRGQLAEGARRARERLPTWHGAAAEMAEALERAARS